MQNIGVQKVSRRRFGPYQLCKYSGRLFEYERSHELRLWGLLFHAYDWWINKVSYHRGSSVSHASFHDHVSPKTFQYILLFFLSHPLFSHPPLLFQISFVSIETGSCPKHSSLMAASFPTGRVSLLPNKQRQPRLQLTISNGSFFYLWDPSVKCEQQHGVPCLCIAVLHVYGGCTEESVYVLCESIRKSLCVIVEPVMRWWY